MKYATIHVSRNGEVIGQWPSYTIRPMFLSGELLPSDMVWAEGMDGWHRLVPEAPVPHEDFAYMGEDTPCYFIRHGQLYGPRSPDEIDALVESGFLGPDDWITHYGGDRWARLDEVLEAPSDGAVAVAAHQPAPGSGPDWVKLGAGLLGSIFLGTPFLDDE